MIANHEWVSPTTCCHYLTTGASEGPEFVGALVGDVEGAGEAVGCLVSVVGAAVFVGLALGTAVGTPVSTRADGASDGDTDAVGCRVSVVGAAVEVGEADGAGAVGVEDGADSTVGVALGNGLLVGCRVVVVGALDTEGLLDGASVTTGKVGRFDGLDDVTAGDGATDEVGAGVVDGSTVFKLEGTTVGADGVTVDVGVSVATLAVGTGLTEGAGVRIPRRVGAGVIFGRRIIIVGCGVIGLRIIGGRVGSSVSKIVGSLVRGLRVGCLVGL